MYLALTIPALVLMILFIAAPLVNAVRISFFKWNGYSQKMRWYGLKNFENIFTDKLFWLATLNTFIYGFGSTILQNILGLAAALFLNNKFKGRNAVRVILYMPIMISAFIMGQILYYFVQVEGGVFNELLGLLGLSGVYWMKTGLSSTIMITLANSWQYMGLCMIIYLAGLQNIPSMYKEAAWLDGANRVCEGIFLCDASASDSVDYDGSCDEPDRRLQAVRCDRCDVGRRSEPEIHVPFVLHFAAVFQ